MPSFLIKLSMNTNADALMLTLDWITLFLNNSESDYLIYQ